VRKDLENTGYIIPTPVIKQFLDDIEDGKHDGIPSLGVYVQPMENVSLRGKYKLQGDTSGILVNYVFPGSSADGVLKQKDVILAIDNYEIASDGSIKFRGGERTDHGYAIQQHQVGEKVKIRYLRDGEELEDYVVLNSEEKPLVANEQYDKVATYFIYGGLVFRPLTMNYLKLSGEDWLSEADVQLLNFMYQFPDIADQEVVVLVTVLPHEMNTGYHSMGDLVITQVNGQNINNLKHMIKLIEDDTDGQYVEFGTIDREAIVLDRKLAEENKAYLLKKYNIPADRSADI